MMRPYFHENKFSLKRGIKNNNGIFYTCSGFKEGGTEGCK